MQGVVGVDVVWMWWYGRYGRGCGQGRGQGRGKGRRAAEQNLKLSENPWMLSSADKAPGIKLLRLWELWGAIAIT